MTDLTLEQCKNLAKWGLPQELVSGHLYWALTLEDRWYRGLFIKAKGSPSVYVKIPDLAELMEFALTLVRKFWAEWTRTRSAQLAVTWDHLDLEWRSDMDGKNLSGWCARSNGLIECDPKPILAVYKLIEKLMEVEGEDD